MNNILSDTNTSVAENPFSEKIAAASPKPTVPIFSEEVNDFCIKHDITKECIRFYELITETFKDIKAIEVDISADYEIENYEHVSFIIDIDDEIDNILRLEKELMHKRIKEIELNKLQYFTFNIK
ncbi:MAG: hypothetical protein HQK91_06450 [Nitrospirae bacterium]|nr:hypothetical protein [Nitrospirota bacterium]MBF0541073.1 hypothetical protein [Nitrospirota bacterium]